MKPDEWLRELAHVWPLLSASAATEVTTLPVPLSFAGVEARVAVDGQRIRHLLVPIRGEEEPKTDASDGSLLLRLRTFTFARTPHRYLDVACTRPDLFDLFDDVLVDVLSTISERAEAPACTAVEVVERWRSLLAIRPPRLLTVTAQMSLMGELHILGLTQHGPLIDVNCWRGPLLEPHDILLPHCAIEVKAVGATSSSVEIHGVHQLEPPGVPLALAIVRVTEGGEGERLPEAVDRILAVASDRGEALRRLASVGYAMADSERYEQRFTVHSVEFVVVDESVPRIIPATFGNGDVPVGVEGVAYHVLLDALDPLFIRGETLLRGWIREAVP